MKSKYVELMGARKAALRSGKEEQAAKLYAAAQKLKKEGKVTEEEFVAAAYIQGNNIKTKFTPVKRGAIDPEQISHLNISGLSHHSSGTGTKNLYK